MIVGGGECVLEEEDSESDGDARGDGDGDDDADTGAARDLVTEEDSGAGAGITDDDLLTLIACDEHSGTGVGDWLETRTAVEESEGATESVEDILDAYVT